VKQSGLVASETTARRANVSCWPAPSRWTTTKSNRCWRSAPTPRNCKARIQGPAPRAPGADAGRRLSPGALPGQRPGTRPGQAKRSFELLRAINSNPPPPLQIERPGLPEDGHESRTWQLGVGTRGDRAFAEYGLRMAYHDLNDNAESFPSARRSKSCS
jgi:hypothetical protein